MAPHLQNLEQQNIELRQRLARETRHRLDQAVEQAVPNFREIDRDPYWHRWLLSTDPLSGRMRQDLLNEAIAAADASKVVSFFRGFLQEARAADQASAPSSRSAASTSSSKPIYTRAQISKPYDQHRRRAYRGREAEWAGGADIFAAQREGRVQFVPHLTK